MKEVKTCIILNYGTLLEKTENDLSKYKFYCVYRNKDLILLSIQPKQSTDSTQFL